MKLKELESNQQRLHEQAYQQKSHELEDKSGKLKIGKSHYKHHLAKITTNHDELLVKVKSWRG